MVQTLNFCDLNSVSSDRLTCVTVGLNYQFISMQMSEMN